MFILKSFFFCCGNKTEDTNVFVTVAAIPGKALFVLRKVIGALSKPPVHDLGEIPRCPPHPAHVHVTEGFSCLL